MPIDALTESSHSRENLSTQLINIENLLTKIRENTAPKPEPEEILTVKEAAAFLRLTPQPIYALIKGKKLHFIKREKRCYFFKTDLVNYLKQGKVEAGVENDRRESGNE